LGLLGSFPQISCPIQATKVPFIDEGDRFELCSLDFVILSHTTVTHYPGVQDDLYFVPFDLFSLGGYRMQQQREAKAQQHWPVEANFSVDDPLSDGAGEKPEVLRAVLAEIRVVASEQGAAVLAVSAR
jgi:hypothetical protein